MLKLANKKKKLVLISSTSEVYGKSTACRSGKTTTSCSGPTSKHRWAYACSKAIDEFLALAYWKERKLPVVVVRLFNTVGPRQTGHYGMVMPPSSAGARRRADHGLRRRHAVAQLHLRRRRRAGHGSLIDEPRAVGQVFNIGNGEEISIGDLAARIKELTGTRPRSS